MKKVLIITFVLSTIMFAQDELADKRIHDVKSAGDGIVFTDDHYSAIYKYKEDKLVQLHSSPGCGRYYTLNKEGTSAGFKLITEEGLQIPARLDLSTGRVTGMIDPVERAGQVSFTDNGAVAFTVDEYLYILSGDKTEKYHLGYYSNIAPVSPDGNYAVFNNAEDNLVLLNLKTNERQIISPEGKGCFHPEWSPGSDKILYSTLNAQLLVYDVSLRKNYELGEGHSAEWLSEERVVFSRHYNNGHELTGADIIVSNYDGSLSEKIENAEHGFGTEPSPGQNGSILYIEYNSSSVYRLDNPDEKAVNKPVLLMKLPELNGEVPVLKKLHGVNGLDIPYIHQVYDTPDDFNGHWACAPTTAMMYIAYENVLPEWPIFASTPSQHLSDYGNYISALYRFREYYYKFPANDPNGNDGYGAYGYMWNGTNRPSTHMASFFQKHGFDAVKVEWPSFASAKVQLDKDLPYSMCVGLTSAGHLVLAHGYGAEEHTFIFNDPYGNKNTAGYPSYDGKDVFYDWPGYNNGYQNLNTVYWCVEASFILPIFFQDNIVDDLQIKDGFYMRTKGGASFAYYQDNLDGYGNHQWKFKTRESEICYTTWRPTLSMDGQYEVFVYMKNSEAEIANYTLQTKDGEETVTLDQRPYSDEWVSLGKYNFQSGTSALLKLSDQSDSTGQWLIADAAKWEYVGPMSVQNDELPEEYSLEQNYPNPFNPSTRIAYNLPEAGYVSLTVFDAKGSIVKEIVSEYKNAGSHYAVFNAHGLSSGIYFYKIKAGSFTAVNKMMFLK